MNQNEIVHMLKASLRLDTRTESVYTGGMNDGPLYGDTVYVQLIFDDEVISEVSL